MNSILAFVLSGVLGRLMALIKFNNKIGQTVSTRVWIYDHLRDYIQTNFHTAIVLEPNVSLVYSLGYVLAFFIVFLLLYAMRIFVKV